MVHLLGMALSVFVLEGEARAVEVDLCAETVESAPDHEALELLDAGDCAPAELLPDVSCEDAPSTFWPAAVNACDTLLLKVRRGASHRGPRLQIAPGRRPLKGVAAQDEGSIRDCGGQAAPLPPNDHLSYRNEPALSVVASAHGPAMQRLPFDRGAAAPLPAGHARRLDRPPEG